ncbi:hypothetical protein [Streptomyces lydicamycinicus]|uniref:hypothetical protein n=1 Tax=Streptomyces lydicamycinicus TaxID=1546107 RepID=UPI003C2D751B
MSTPPATADTPAPDTAHTLGRNAVGAGDLVFFVVAAAAPLTVTAGAAPVAIGMAGQAAPLGYLLSGLLMIVFAAGFTAMSRHVRNAGAFYACIGRGLGRATGAGSAYVAVLSYNAIEVGLLAVFGWFTESGFRNLTGVHVPWGAWATAGIVAIGVLGCLKVALSAKVLALALALEATSISGRDPYAVTFLWSNGTGIVGIMLLQALAALAVHRFFRRDRRGLPARRVVAAPLTACAGLAVLLVLVCRNFGLLTGASTGVNLALLAPLPLAFALGAAVALRLRHRAPRTYARLTTVDAERG